MSIGLGNGIFTQQREVTPVIPPATVTGAQNATSIVGTDVEFGGNPLLHNTSFDMAGFFLQSFNGGDQQLLIIGTDYAFGDIDAGAGGTHMKIEATGQTFTVASGAAADKGLLLDFGNGLYEIGDVDNFDGNNTFLEVNSAAGVIQANLFDGTGPAGQFSIGKTGNAVLAGNDGAGNSFEHRLFPNSTVSRYIQSANGSANVRELSDGTNPMVELLTTNQAGTDFQFLDLRRDSLTMFGGVGGVSSSTLVADLTNGLYQFGDIGSIGNGSYLNIDDTAEAINLRIGGDEYLSIDKGTLDFYFGDVGSGGGTTLYLGNSTGSAQAQIYNSGDVFIEIDQAGGIYQFGDVSASGNGMILYNNDTGREVKIEDSLGQYLVINAANGFYEFGDRSGTLNGTQILIDDSNKTIGFFIEGVVTSYFALNDSMIFAGDTTYTGKAAYFEAITSNANGQAVLYAQDDVANVVSLELNGGGFIKTTGVTQLIGTTTSFSDGAGAGAGTITNAPAAGNPTKWIPIDDNGTTRHIPAW